MKVAARFRAALMVAFFVFGFHALSAPPSTNAPALEFCGTVRAWMNTQEGRDYTARMDLTGTCPLFGDCDQPANRDANIPVANAAVKIVKLRFQVFANDDGGNAAATASQIASQVGQLNADYESSRIQFSYSMRVINSTLYRNCPSNSENALKIAFAENPSQQINIFVTRFVGFNNGGIATFPWTASSMTSTGGVMLQDFSVNPGAYSVPTSFTQCISHEMGHMLGLTHTFRGSTEVGSTCQNCRELVGRSVADGDVSGDYCSDTAPDPGITILSGTCSVSGTNDSCNGQPFSGVDTANIMSYYQSCYSRFTPQQRGRMHCWMGSIGSVWFYDNTTPGVAITAPTNGSYSIAPTVTGTASDDNALKRVRIALARNSDGAWWDWTNNAFGSTTFDFSRHAKWADGTTSWNTTLPNLPDGAYQVQAQSVDLGENTSGWVTRFFNVDSTTPTIGFSPLTNAQTVFNFDQIGGTISEAATVKFKIEWFKSGGNQFWNGVNWSSDGSDGNALLAANVSGLNWSPAVVLPSRSQISAGNYLVYGYVTDAAGLSASANIVLARSPADTTPPVVTATFDTGTVFTNNFLPILQGLAGDPESGVDLVQLFLMRLTPGVGYEYWDGNSWTATPFAITCNYHDGFWWELPASFAQPSGSNLRNGDYTMQVSARNQEAPANTTLISINFSVDYHPVFTWTAGSWSDSDPNNNDDNWGNPANWSPYGVPTSEANVFVNGNPQARYLGSIEAHRLTHSGGTLYASNLNVKFLNQSGGRLHIENKLQLGNNGGFDWTGGELYGGTAKLGSFNVPTNGTVTISNNAGKAIYSLTFNNSGTVRWSGGNIYGDEALINNGPTGLWEASGAFTLNLWPGFGAGTRGFNNYGTFRKLGAVETAHQGYFKNYGVIESEAGVFTVFDAMTWENGSRIGGAGSVRLVNGCCGATATVAGSTTLDGTFDLSEGNTYIRGSGGIALTSNGVLRVSSGYVGGNIDISGAGQIVWTGGGFDGTNTLNTTVNVTGAATKYFNRGGNTGLTILNNQGVINISGPGSIQGWARSAYSEQPGRFNNYGTLRFLSDSTPFVRDGDYTAFNNYGTIVKAAGTNETTFHSFRLHNFASIICETGTLAFVDEVNLNTNTFLNGIGRIRFAGSIAQSNDIVASGLIRMDGGSFYATTNLDATPRGRWLGTNTFEWAAGTIYGHLTLGTSVVMNISGASTKYFGSLTAVDNFGQVNWLGGGRVQAWARSAYSESPSYFNNMPGAVFRFASDGYPFARDGDYSFFTNRAGALVIKTAGSDRTTVDSFRFINSGEVRANVGTIEFTDMLHLRHGGVFSGVGTNTINGGTHTIDGTTSIDGTRLVFSGGILYGTLATAATLQTPNNGVVEWSGGTIASNLTFASASTVHITGSAPKYFGSGATLNNHGYVRWLGSGYIYTFSRPAYSEVPSTWINTSGAVFDAWNDSYFSQDGAACTFANLAGATFRKSAGANTIVYWLLDNGGTVEALAGRIELAGGGSGPGTFFADSGAHVKFTGGNYTLVNATLAGNGQVQVDGATLTTAGNVSFNSPATLELLSGTINGAGNLSGSPVINWTGGTLGGTQHIAAGSVFNISGSARKYLASRSVINNEGVINWSGPGDIYAWARGAYSEGPSTINNHGTFRFLTEGAPFVRDGDYSYFNNFGTLSKADGTNETLIHSFVLNNYGSILSQTGTLAFVDYVNFGANSQLNGQSRIRLAGYITQSNTVTASGSIRMDGGWFNSQTNADGTAQGSWLGANTFDWVGGTLYGHHTFGVGVVFNIADPGASAATKYFGSATTIDNYGQVNWSGNGRVQAMARGAYNEFPSTFNNRPGATFRILNDGYPFGRDGDYSRFTNYAGALVTKVGGADRSTIDSWTFANSGEVRAQTGTIEFSDVLHLRSGGEFSGTGTHLISAGNHSIAGPTTVNALVKMSGGTLTGLADATLAGGTGTFEWTGGWIGGEFTFGSGLESVFSTETTKAFSPSSLIRNGGTIRWTGGDIWSPGRNAYSEAPMTFRNEAGATFIAVSNNAFTTWERAHTFENFGTFVKSNGTATTACNWLFNNSGALDLQSGTLALNISPTGFTGGTLRFALGGTTPGVDHGKLALAGSQSLGGSVDVSLKNGFTPAPGNTFALVTYGTRMGGFSPISFASVLGADWFSRYDAAGFIVGVRAPVSCLSITNGLIAWWTGDGGTNVLASGNVTPSNGATNDIGFNGQAFHLDGNDDYWSVPDSTNFRPANLTVEGWVSFNGYGGLRTFFGKPYGSGPQDSFTVWLDGTTLRAVVTTPSGFGPILGYPFTPEIGRWYHIAFTFDDTNDLQTLYLDGAPVASGTVTESIVYDTRPLVIGADIENGSYAFFHNGFIDEVTLYDRPLSAMEIASIHRADSVGRCTSTPTLTNFAQLIAPTWSNGVFRTTIVAQNQAARAVVLASENLVTWTPIQTNAPFTGTFLLVDPSATTNRFYRLRIE